MVSDVPLRVKGIYSSSTWTTPLEGHPAAEVSVTLVLPEAGMEFTDVALVARGNAIGGVQIGAVP
jgi:hypothetical protein